MLKLIVTSSSLCNSATTGLAADIFSYSDKLSGMTLALFAVAWLNMGSAISSTVRIRLSVVFGIHSNHH